MLLSPCCGQRFLREGKDHTKDRIKDGIVISLELLVFDFQIHFFFF